MHVLAFKRSATDRDQLATEDSKGGLFTQCLVHGLEGRADGRGDGEVDLEEIVDYVGRELPRLSRLTQTPQFSSTRLLNEILFVPLTSVAAPVVADADEAPASPQAVAAPVAGK